MNPALPPPRPLLPVSLALNSDEFRSIQAWNYPAEPFYVDQVRRALQHDIPQLVVHRDCSIWGYSDPQLGKDFVGFGILQIEEHYSGYTGGLPHCYIPLLSVKPGIKSLGYGRSIVDHLIAEAALNVRDFEGFVSNYLFLDVYVANQPAIQLYRDKCQFVVLNAANPISDPDEHDEPYFVMARNVALPEKTTPAPMPS